MYEVATSEAVVRAIEALNSTRIGIDGTDGSGKSTLAKAVGAHLGLSVVSLDDYLTKQQGGFLDFLDYDRLRGDLLSTDRFVVEGVCLLDALKRTDTGIECLVYVKRMHLGLWADERALEVEEPLEEFLEKERQLTAMLCRNEEPITDLGPEEEIIRYHYAMRPHNTADIIFLRKDEH